MTQVMDLFPLGTDKLSHHHNDTDFVGLRSELCWFVLQQFLQEVRVPHTQLMGV